MLVPTPAAANSRRRVVVALVALTATIGAIALLHAPFARSLLMRAGGCPMVSAKLTVAQAENGRHLGLRALKGNGVAPVRPALAFTLDVTTLAEARAWASSRHVECEEPREGLLHCPQVTPIALGLPTSEGPAELALGFDLGGRLVDVTTFRSQLPVEAASRAATEIASSLVAALGDAPTATGSFDVEHLSRPSAWSIATRSYRFGDYVAGLTAMRAPSGGFAVREQYLSARD
jgi:hypothetical protein